MTLSFFSISLNGSVWIFLLFALSSLLLAFYFYRHTIPPLPLSKRIFLTALRSVSLLIILLILFEPILSLVSTKTKKPTIAVIIDNTQSLTVSEKNTHHLEKLKQFLKSNQIDNSFQKVDVQYYSFSSHLSSYQNFSYNSLKMSGEITDISASFSELKDKIKNENCQGAILISDGDYNVGKNPVYEAEKLGIPIYSIGVGDTTDQKDVMILKVQTNNIAYAETRVPVDVTVRWSGCKNENAEVVLNEGQNILDRKIITLAEGTNETQLKMFYESKEEGTHKLTVSVSKISGELTEKNNYKSFFIKVLKSKLQVLLIAGAPSPDVSTISQTLSEDENINLTRFIQKAAGEYYERRFTQSLLDSADCFILIGYPNSATSANVLNQIRNIIEQNLKPVLFIGSKNLDYNKLEVLKPYLPFSWSVNNSTEISIFATIPDKIQKYPLIYSEGNTPIEAWLRLPPIYKTSTQFKSKPESDVLANVKTQSINLNEPLILTRNISRQKSLAITGYGIWRWRMLVQDNPQAEKLLYTFLTNSIRWLTTKEDEKNVKVTPAKESFTTADAVEFTGQVYDDQYRQVDNAEVKVELVSEGRKSELVLGFVGSGLYEGNINGLPEGDYTYAAKAIADGRVLGEDKGKITIGKMNIEFLDTKMNKQLLEQIAYKTGGTYASIENADTILSSITKRKFGIQEITTVKEIEIWNWEYAAGLLILLLALEWFIRKRSGMV
jgi:hypothetical protein